MDLYNQIVPFVVIMVIRRGNCSDLTATFANGVFNVSCTSPPSLIFHNYGYIQCQQACIRHSNCAWIIYVKDYLACSFFLDGQCVHSAAGKVKYLKRTDIEEKIGGFCWSSGCAADTVCAKLHDGTHICIPDKVHSGIPFQIEGSTQESGGSTFTDNCHKDTDCGKLQFGDYQSCTGCHYFLTCAPSGGIVRPCPGNLVFDLDIKACVTSSDTCIGP